MYLLAGWMMALGMTHFTRVQALWSFGVVSDIGSFVCLDGVDKRLAVAKSAYGRYCFTSSWAGRNLHERMEIGRTSLV